MAEKTLEERLSELYEKIDHRDQFFDKDLKTLIDGIRDAREHGGTASVDVTPIVGGYKIVITDSEGVEHVATVKDGGDAYEVYKSTVPEGQSPMMKEEWLETLKGADGQDGATPTINQTTKHWEIGGSDTGVLAEGHNPNRGTYLDTDTKPTTGQAGDYIYVVDTSVVTPRTANVWAWNGTAFADTGKSVENFGLSFATGQAVNEVYIKKLSGENAGNASGVPELGDVVEAFENVHGRFNGLDSQIDCNTIDISKLKSNAYSSELLSVSGLSHTNYISKSSGKWVEKTDEPSNIKYYGYIIDVEDYVGRTIIFSDIKALIEAGVRYLYSAYAFLTSNDTTPGTEPSYCSGYGFVELDTERTSVVPTDAKYMWVYAWRYNKSILPTMRVLSQMSKIDEVCNILSIELSSEISFDESAQENYISKSSGKWAKKTAAIYGYVVDIEDYAGKVVSFSGIRITEGSGLTLHSAYAFLTSNDTTPGTEPSYCSGHGFVSLFDNTKAVIPTDAKYMWVYARRGVAFVLPSTILVEDFKFGADFGDAQARSAFVSAMQTKSAKMGLDITIEGPAGYPDNQISDGHSMAKMYLVASGYFQLASIWNQKDDVTIYSKGYYNTSHLLHSSIFSTDAEGHYANCLTDYYTMLGGKTGSWAPYSLLGAIIQGPNGRLLVGWVRKNTTETATSNRWTSMKILMDIAFDKLLNNGSSVATLQAQLVADGVHSAQVLIVPQGGIAQNYETYDFYTINTSNGYEDYNIYSYNATTQQHIASNTKVLTIITALDYISDLEKLVRIKVSDIQPGTHPTPDFSDGEQFTVRELMLAMMMPSSNTAAYAVARYVGNILLNQRYGGVF